MRLEKWVEAGRIHIKDVVRMLRDQSQRSEQEVFPLLAHITHWCI